MYYPSASGCVFDNTEVPLSSQWNSGGYYYPTQIAQYGLSHYSKYIAERRRHETKPPSSIVFGTGDNEARSPSTVGGWRRSPTIRGTGVLRRAFDAAVQRSVYRFKTPGASNECLTVLNKIAT